MIPITYKTLFEEWFVLEKTKGLLGMQFFWTPHVLLPIYRKKEGLVLTEEDIFQEICDILTTPTIFDTQIL